MTIKHLGWSNQIHCNLIEISTEKTRIIIDSGWKILPTDNQSDIGCLTIEGLTYGPSDIDAVFVTNFYADHIGIIEQIKPDIPIYLNKNVKNVLDIFADFNNTPLPRVDKYLEHGRKEQIGDITVLPICVDLKTTGRMLFLIEGGGQRFLYTEGFKHIDPAYHAMLGEIDVMLCECMHFGTESDMDICDLEDTAARIMHETNGHVFVLCNPTDYECIKHIERACRKSGRSLVIDPLFKTVQEQITNPLFINPVGLMPPELEITPRIQKHLNRNYDIDFEDMQFFSDINAVAKMSNLTFLVCPSQWWKIFSQLKKQINLSGSTLINLIWEGYENWFTEAIISKCKADDLKVKTLRVSNHIYREQLKIAAMQLNLLFLVPINEIIVNIFYNIHRKSGVFPFDCNLHTIGFDIDALRGEREDRR
jgi:ribonuclease J